jgi:hypothetical protein
VTIGEERAVESVKAGVTDYVLKNRLERLVPAVRRALRETQERAERQRANNRAHPSDGSGGGRQRDCHYGSGRIDLGKYRVLRYDWLLLPEVLGRNPRFLKSGQHDPAFYRAMWQTIQAGQVRRGDNEPPQRWNALLQEMTITSVHTTGGNHSFHRRHAGHKRTEACRSRVAGQQERFRQLAENINEVFWIKDPGQKSDPLYQSAFETIWVFPAKAFIEAQDLGGHDLS